MALTNDDLLVVQSTGDGELYKVSVKDINAGALTVVSDTAPNPDNYSAGALWFNSDEADGSLYVLYDDPDPAAAKKWVQIAVSVDGLEAGFQTTGTLPLDNPTTFSRPDESGLGTQADFNSWIVNYVDEVDAKTELEGALVFKGSVADEGSLPDGATAAIGDFYVTLDTEEYFAWNGSEWVKVGTNVDVTAPTISNVLAEGNVALPTQALRFRIDENSTLPDPGTIPTPDPDDIGNPNTYGSVHRALASTHSYVDSSGRLYYTAVTEAGFYNGYYDHDYGEWSQLILSGGNSGLYFDFPIKDVECDISAYSIKLDGRNAIFEADVWDEVPVMKYLSYSGKDVEVRIDGSVTAKEFIGDGSQVTNVPLPDFRTLPVLS